MNYWMLFTGTALVVLGCTIYVAAIVMESRDTVGRPSNLHGLGDEL